LARLWRVDLYDSQRAMSDETPAHPLIGLLVVAAGSVPYLASSNVLPSDDSDFGAPRWAVAWIVVVCFVYPGLMILGGVRTGDGGQTRRSAGLFGPVTAALLPAALALHAGTHALTRAGGVQAAWLVLATLTAWVAYLYGRRLVGLVVGLGR
jgi:hypothetical protein